MNNQLNRDSSIEQKKSASEAVFENLVDFFFDKVNYVTLVFSRFSSGGGTTSTSAYATGSRIIDTSEGKFFSERRTSRMSCSFYTQNANQLEGYILSPAVFDSTGSLGAISNLSSLRAYLGIKIDGGTVTVVVKDDGKDEVLYPTDITIAAGFSETFRLETRYNINTAEVLIDGSLIGVYNLDWSVNEKTTKTFYPLFSPGKTKNSGTTVDIVIENFQFIQNK